MTKVVGEVAMRGKFYRFEIVLCALVLTGICGSNAVAQDAVQKIADDYVSAWKAKQPLPAFSSYELESDEDTLPTAYAVQQLWVKQTLDEAGSGGIKGAAVTEAGQKSLGLKQPLVAILRKSGELQGVDLPKIDQSRWPGLKIETELAFVVGKPIDSELASVADFKKHIRAVIPAIELPAGVWKHDNKPNASDIAAMNVGSASYILGAAVDPAKVDLREVKISLSKDGKQLHTAVGAECWQGPWETGLYLANVAHKRGDNLQPGQVILCGALGTIQPGEPGKYVADYGELGRIEFTIVEALDNPKDN